MLTQGEVFWRYLYSYRPQASLANTPATLFALQLVDGVTAQGGLQKLAQDGPAHLAAITWAAHKLTCRAYQPILLRNVIRSEDRT